MLGIAWIALPVLSFLYEETVGRLLRAARDVTFRIRSRLSERRARHRAERERRRAQRAWERAAPHRERQRREAEEEARRQAAAQRCREDARAAVELLYSLYAPEIGQRFPREAFDAFCSTYLNDQKTPEYVEERALQLRSIIEQHREKSPRGNGSPRCPI